MTLLRAFFLLLTYSGKDIWIIMGTISFSACVFDTISSSFTNSPFFIPLTRGVTSRESHNQLVIRFVRFGIIILTTWSVIWMKAHQSEMKRRKHQQQTTWRVPPLYPAPVWADNQSFIRHESPQKRGEMAGGVVFTICRWGGWTIIVQQDTGKWTRMT